jgi:hypothetical protein
VRKLVLQLLVSVDAMLESIDRILLAGTI